MADEQAGQAQLSLQILHEVKNLRLDGTSPKRDRLVGDDCRVLASGQTDALERPPENRGVAVQISFEQPTCSMIFL